MLLALSSRSLVNLVVADNVILQRIADIRAAWLTNVMKAIGLLATGPAMQALWLVNDTAQLPFVRIAEAVEFASELPAVQAES